MSILKSLFIVAILLALIAIVGTNDRKDKERFNDTYCEMVTTHIVSGGVEGWPDFEGKYNEWCE